MISVVPNMKCLHAAGTGYTNIQQVSITKSSSLGENRLSMFSQVAYLKQEVFLRGWKDTTVPKRVKIPAIKLGAVERQH